MWGRTHEILKSLWFYLSFELTPMFSHYSHNSAVSKQALIGCLDKKL